MREGGCPRTSAPLVLQPGTVLQPGRVDDELCGPPWLWPCPAPPAPWPGSARCSWSVKLMRRCCATMYLETMMFWGQGGQ